MFAEILRRTPVWVFGLCALLVVGLVQSRQRVISRAAVWVLPVTMALLSIYAAAAAFGVSLVSGGAWLAGFYFAFWRNSSPEWQSKISFDPARRQALALRCRCFPFPVES